MGFLKCYNIKVPEPLPVFRYFNVSESSGIKRQTPAKVTSNYAQNVRLSQRLNEKSSPPLARPDVARESNHRPPPIQLHSTHPTSVVIKTHPRKADTVSVLAVSAVFSCQR